MAYLRFTEENLKWLFLSFAFYTASLFFSYWIFPSQASILAISFLVIALTPPFYQMMENEEEVVARKVEPFWVRYDGIIVFLLVVAAGIFLSSAFWYNTLPSDPSYSGARCSTTLPCKEAVFGLQSSVLERDMTMLLSMMVLCFLFSLLLGVGAILIIVWDVSSLAIGSTPGHIGFVAYLPQLMGFFLAGLAGALLSFAVLRHEWRGLGFMLVFRDSLVLLAISLLLTPVSSFLLSLL